MRYRTLAWLPVIVAAALLGVELAMGPTPARGAVLRGEVEVAKVFWLASAVAAALVFERGDYLRRAWLLLGASSASFLVRDATLLSFVDESAGTSLAVVRGVIVVLGNVAQVGGIWALSRVWTAAGLEDHDERSRWQARTLLGGAVVLSLGIMGPSLFHDATSLGTGNLEALPHLASDLGDAICFILIGRLVRVALALRGGIVSWTWTLFAASQISWMLFDGARTLTELYGATASTPPLVECLRVVGAGYLCAAGVAQRWVVVGRNVAKPAPGEASAGRGR
jgi:hypothetical protein